MELQLLDEDVIGESYWWSSSSNRNRRNQNEILLEMGIEMELKMILRIENLYLQP